jgi:hypothetical protein
MPKGESLIKFALIEANLNDGHRHCDRGGSAYLVLKKILSVICIIGVSKLE